MSNAPRINGWFVPQKSCDHRKLSGAVNALKDWLEDQKRQPTVGLVLGSVLCAYVDTLPKDHPSVSYEEIDLPPLPDSNRRGRLHLASIGGREVIILEGRIRYYDGLPLDDVVLAVRALQQVGVETYIITSAARALHEKYKPGDLVIVNGHIDPFGIIGHSLLSGVEPLRIGPRHPDLADPYDRPLRDLAAAASETLGIKCDWGVYGMTCGPAHGTLDEAHLLRKCGAGLVGMSLVPEAIALRHLGARVLGLARVANIAANIAATSVGPSLPEVEVKQKEREAIANFSRLIPLIIEGLPA